MEGVVLSGAAEEVEVFERRMGRFRTVDTCSDADDIMDKFVGNRGIVRFRITYSGELKASGKQSRRLEKDAIRSYISPQLHELSTKHPVFRGYGLRVRPAPIELPSGRAAQARQPLAYPAPHMVQVEHRIPNVDEQLATPISVRGCDYIPIVRRSFALTCSLDILFMRKDGPGRLIAEGGDLDNRIKTLFDGLRVPKPDEVEQAPPPEEGSWNLKFCLLEDDALITDFAVRTDRLLTHPGGSESEVLLVIDVVVRVEHLTSLNLGFLSE